MIVERLLRLRFGVCPQTLPNYDALGRGSVMMRRTELVTRTPHRISAPESGRRPRQGIAATHHPILAPELPKVSRAVAQALYSLPCCLLQPLRDASSRYPQPPIHSMIVVMDKKQGLRCSFSAVEPPFQSAGAHVTQTGTGREGRYHCTNKKLLIDNSQFCLVRGLAPPLVQSRLRPI